MQIVQVKTRKYKCRLVRADVRPGYTWAMPILESELRMLWPDSKQAQSESDHVPFVLIDWGFTAQSTH